MPADDNQDQTNPITASSDDPIMNGSLSVNERPNLMEPAGLPPLPDKDETLPPPAPVEIPQPLVTDSTNVGDLGVKDIGMLPSNEDKPLIEVKRRGNRAPLVAGILALFLLVIASAAGVFYFSEYSGDIRQRASGYPPGYGFWNIGGLPLSQDINNWNTCYEFTNPCMVNTGSDAWCGCAPVNPPSTIGCLDDPLTPQDERRDEPLGSPTRVVNGAGTACATTTTPTPAPNCSTEGVVLSWTDKAGVKHTTGEMSVPFNPTERFYAANCTAKTSGWSLLASPDTNFSRVVFSITDASGKDPNLVSSYVDAEVGAVYDTLYLTCRKNTQDCGSMQLVRGAATTPTPVLTSTLTPTPIPTPVAMCVDVRLWTYAPGQGCLPTPDPIADEPNVCVAGDWKEVVVSQLTPEQRADLLKIGNTLRFTVRGNNVSLFTKARFTINGATPIETTTKYGADYYIDYQLTQSGTLTVTGELFK